MSAAEFNLNCAELSLASYANLSDGNLALEGQRTALETVGFAHIQAEEFSLRFPEIVVQFDDVVSSTSFSVTVFKGISGNLSLAIRGSQELLGDFIPTDSNIALNGAGYDQIVAMYNWWLRATALDGVLVPQFCLVQYGMSSLPSPSGLFLYAGAGVLHFLELAPAIAATGELISALGGDTDHRVDVVGHSLGGHLALAFNALFPDLTNQVATFNAPGFINSTKNQQFFELLGGTVPGSENSNNVANIIADESGVGGTPWSPIAGLHSRPGEAIDIAIERQFPSDEPKKADAGNHSQVILADSLAVFNFLATLSPTITLTDYKSILAAAANGTAASYERIVDAFELLLGVDVQVMPIGNDQRNSLYAALKGLHAVIDDLGLVGTVSLMPLANLDAEEIFEGANGSLDAALAYRYALRTLDPFIAVGNPGLYSMHNLNGELDFYNSTSHLGSMTLEWLKDRSEMLSLKNQSSAADGKVTFSRSGRESLQYIDKTLMSPDGQNDLLLNVSGSLGAALLNPYKIIFGANGEDSIFGSDLAIGDHLYGEAGDDFLNGAGGFDYMEGGKGFDVYVWEESDNFDVILDVDGLGRISMDGVFLNGGVGIGNGFYISSDKRFSFFFYGDLQGGGDLYIDGSILIKNFRNGDLGLNLSDGPNLSSIQSTDGVIVASAINATGIGSNADDYFKSGVIIESQVGPLYDQFFFGLGGNDFVVASEVDIPVDFDPGQYVIGGAGDDVMFGRSTIFASALYGEGGSDIIFAGHEGSTLYGDADIERLVFQLNGSMESTGLVLDYGFSSFGVGAKFIFSNNVGQYYDSYNGDELEAPVYFAGGITEVLEWLGVFDSDSSAVSHDDDLLGGDGPDIVFGGAGKDYVYGGGGNDELYGGNTRANGLYFNASLSSLATEEVLVLRGQLNGLGDDFLDGGSGSDFIVDSDGGSDELIGGSDSDVLIDENPDAFSTSGYDYLDGGKGDDLIFSEHLYAPGSALGWSALFGDEGNDLLVFKEGEGYLEGDEGDDVYWIRDVRGGQILEINNFDVSDQSLDRLLLDGANFAGQTFSAINEFLEWNRLEIHRHVDDLELEYVDRDRLISIRDWFLDDLHKIDEIVMDGGISLSGVGLHRGEWGGLPYWSYDGDGFVLSAEGVESLINNFVGSDFDDDFKGNSLRNILEGMGGDDYLFGLSGDDSLIGGGGIDTLDGGDGIDTADYQSSPDAVTVILDVGLLGIAKVLDAGNDGWDGSDYVIDIENVRGSNYDDLISGDADSNLIDGNAGADIIAGGAGNDIYILDNSGDQVMELGDSGVDDVQSDVAYNLMQAWHVENLTLTGGNSVNGSGNWLNNVIKGNEAANMLNGNRGDDTLIGGVGIDTLIGGLGDDVYRVESNFDRIVIAEDDATIGNLDRIQLGSNIIASDIFLTRLNDDLVIYTADNQHSIQVMEWFAGDAHKVERIEFASGISWDAATIV